MGLFVEPRMKPTKANVSMFDSSDISQEALRPICNALNRMKQ